MLRCARTSSVYSHHGSSIRICLCSLFTDNNRRLNKFSTSMICLSTDFYKHNTLVKSSENQEIARTTSSSGPVRVLYSRELLIPWSSTIPWSSHPKTKKLPGLLLLVNRYVCCTVASC